MQQKKHHEYLVRVHKEDVTTDREIRLKQSRITQRRVRLYEKRISQAKGKEVDIMKALNEKMMSDEETDSGDKEVLIVRTPPWRSEKLNSLFNTLDTHYHKKSDGRVKTSRKRKSGLPSTRLPCKGAPSWAFQSDYSADSGTTSSRSDSPTTSPPSNSNALVAADTGYNNDIQLVQYSTPPALNNTPVTLRMNSGMSAHESHTPSTHNTFLPPARLISSSDSFGDDDVLGPTIPTISDDECNAILDEDSDHELTSWIKSVACLRD